MCAYFSRITNYTRYRRYLTRVVKHVIIFAACALPGPLFFYFFKRDLCSREVIRVSIISEQDNFRLQ